MRWLAGCSARALHEALEAVAPELGGYDVPVDVVGSIDLDGAARQLASFLAALHLPAARERAEAVIGPLTGAEIPRFHALGMDRFG